MDVTPSPFASNSTNESSSSSSSVDVISSSSSISNETVDANDLDKSVSSNTGDSCTWYNDSECTRPRTCSDCLNVLLSTDACAVDPSGVCVSISEYESYLANRYYYTPLKHYYTSSEYTYCNADDSECASCSAQWKANFASTGNPGMSSFCTGTGGCVCIADCEVSDWQDSVIDGQCFADGSDSDTDLMTSMATHITVSLFVGVLVVVLLAFATWGVRRLVNHRENESSVIGREMRARRSAPTGLQLSLTGWKSLRQNLIDSEHGNGSDTVTLQRDCERTFRIENVLGIRVEHGQGFRPESRAELDERTQDSALREI